MSVCGEAGKIVRIRLGSVGKPDTVQDRGHVKSDGQRLSRLKAVDDVLLGGGEYDCKKEGILPA
jgi:hypothetical protein